MMNQGEITSQETTYEKVGDVTYKVLTTCFEKREPITLEALEACKTDKEAVIDVIDADIAGFNSVN